ncbi:dynamin family protein [Clostridium manihotivorum]|uniref:Dynamin family protein n=1 Tax=Clostridium manihotivorum TaxID=2320868 RepID=A0A3R5QWR6_9CLOT|nr:dynamin family protein [Clostridium manihotivorum]QAA31320.1 dynamin family protein [Clostridium manihotivorum]
MLKDNKILKYIDDVQEVLEKNQYRVQRYRNNLEWFKNRKKQINNSIIRVAIMGITSSGKSTLVNAILGEQILPVAIKPSSSIIITCSKANDRQATIFFEDGTCNILKGKDLNEKNIGKYADESNNPNNKFKVVQIDITTPAFLLGDNIHIIDSPGLDACNLDMHERLTIEVLLPTIDICIFLTTVKANSDAVNVEKIKIVNSKEKQIILVQNMIDSIEAKIGKNGVVVEDKREILKKHKKRAENLLKSGTGTNNNFEVIQLSALNALNGIMRNDKALYNESNLDKFNKAIKSCIVKIAPKLEQQRIESISDKIHEIINQEEKIIGKNQAGNISNIIAVSDDEFREFVIEFEDSKENIKLKIDEIDKITRDTITKISESNSTEIDGYESIIEEINKKNRQIENSIIDIVKGREANKQELYRKLNLDMRQDYSLPSMESKNLEVKHKYETKTIYHEKSGLLNWIKRKAASPFDADWGYDVEYKDVKVIDKDSTIKMVENICNQNKAKYLSVLEQWRTNYYRAINLFKEELNKQKQEYEEKLKKKVETDEIQDVIKNLKNLLKSLKVKNNNDVEESIAVTISEDNNACVKENKVIISRAQYDMYILSNQIIEKNYLKIGEYIKENGNEILKVKSNQVFWTWDLEPCIEFISRVCGISFTEEDLTNIRKKGVLLKESIFIVYELCENKEHLYIELSNIKNQIFNMYILFNGIQIGNTEKQIINNNILQEFSHNNTIVVNMVIDSYKEFINADNISELLLEVEVLKNKFLKKMYKVKEGYILINSKNPMYNIALIECQEQKKLILSSYRTLKLKLFKSSLLRGKNDQAVVEKILKHYADKK